MWFLYLIECRTPDHYYVGITTQPYRRQHRHERGIGAQFTFCHGVKSFELLETYPTLASALKAECELTKELREIDHFTVAGSIWTRTQ